MATVSELFYSQTEMTMVRKKISARLIKTTLIFAGAVMALLMLESVHSQPRKRCRPARECFEVKYKGVEIRDFLKGMTGHLRRNILIDESVKGKITIEAYEKVHRSRALEFLRQVMEVKGYAVVDDGEFIKVMPLEEARNSSLPTDEFAANKHGVVSQILQMPGQVNVSELANVIKNVAGKNTTVVVYRPTNTIVITGYARNVRRALAIAKDITEGLDPEAGGSNSTDSVHIYRARHMTAESLAQVLVRLENPLPLSTGVITNKPGDKKPIPAQSIVATKPGGKIKAVAHKESNSIVITANPGEWSEIHQIIQQLDSPRHQILLEVLIAEVSSSSTNDFGIDWRFQKTDAPHTQFNTGLAVEGSLVDTESGAITGNNTLNGFSLGFLEKNGDILAILNANINNTNFNVLSSPQILTLDNQEAEINVGQDVPVRTQERTSGGGSSESTVNSFEYRPSGIKLKFTPHVNADNRIGLDLFSEITTIEDAQNPNSNPRFNKRNIKTYVTVKNKQTIVIGGLVFTEKLDSVVKVPLLGDIPLLGHLFRRTTKNIRRTNLMLFITPHIMDKRGDADNTTEYKRNLQRKETLDARNDIILWPQQRKKGGREDELEEIDDDL